MLCRPDVQQQYLVRLMVWYRPECINRGVAGSSLRLSDCNRGTASSEALWCVLEQDNLSSAKYRFNSEKSPEMTIKC